MAKRTTIDLIGRDREQLLIIADLACTALARIADYVTTDEGDREDSEEEIGLEFSEIVEMAHDDMIQRARSALDGIILRFPSPPKKRRK